MSSRSKQAFLLATLSAAVGLALAQGVHEEKYPDKNAAKPEAAQPERPTSDIEGHKGFVSPEEQKY